MTRLRTLYRRHCSEKVGSLTSQAETRGYASVVEGWTATKIRKKVDFYIKHSSFLLLSM
jgi:hypothetical protein